MDGMRLILSGKKLRSGAKQRARGARQPPVDGAGPRRWGDASTQGTSRHMVGSYRTMHLTESADGSPPPFPQKNPDPRRGSWSDPGPCTFPLGQSCASRPRNPKNPCHGCPSHSHLFTYCRVGLCPDTMRTSSRMPHPIHFLGAGAPDLEPGPVPGRRTTPTAVPLLAALVSSARNRPVFAPTPTPCGQARKKERRGRLVVLVARRPRKARGGHLGAVIQCHVMRLLGPWQATSPSMTMAWRPALLHAAALLRGPAARGSRPQPLNLLARRRAVLAGWPAAGEDWHPRGAALTPAPRGQAAPRGS